MTVHELNIVDMCDLSVDDALDLFDNKLQLTEQEMTIARLIVKEIKSRLAFMSNVGLNYLELSRAANTLSGGGGAANSLGDANWCWASGCALCTGRGRQLGFINVTTTS